MLEVVDLSANKPKNRKAARRFTLAAQFASSWPRLSLAFILKEKLSSTVGLVSLEAHSKYLSV